MQLRIYNTMSKEKEIFKPISENTVNMFVCGQTPYDDAHLGHAKTYVNFDVVVRWLRSLGYKVTYIQNITDIEDKIIIRANQLNIAPQQLENKYEQRFMEDMNTIKVKDNVNNYPKSHDYIEQIRLQIQALLDKQYAYLVDNDIYYDVDKFKDYTKLSGMKLEELTNHRIDPKEGKKNQYDFALWKASKASEPKWSIQVIFKGKKITLEGRPGWHIEDTAITQTIFGPQYDIHGGAIELIFPHHTNEIAQEEAASGIVPFVNYWMHSGVLNIKGKKMSKSERNFITIREITEKHNPEALRLFICSTHYRKPIEYTGEQSIDEAAKKLSYMYSALSAFYNMKDSNSSSQDEDQLNPILNEHYSRFTDAMNDDFNTPLAMMQLSSIINTIRKFAESTDSITDQSKTNTINKILQMGSIMGILEMDHYKAKVPHELNQMIKDRNTLREKGDYATADKIREKIQSDYGIEISDTEHGTMWYIDINKLKKTGT